MVWLFAMQVLDPTDPRDVLWILSAALLPPATPPVAQLLQQASRLSKERQAAVLGPDRAAWHGMLQMQEGVAYNDTPRLQAALLQLHAPAAAAARTVRSAIASMLCDASIAQYEPGQAAAFRGTATGDRDADPVEDMALGAGAGGHRRLQGATRGSGAAHVKWRSVDELYRCRCAQDHILTHVHGWPHRHHHAPVP